MYFLLSIHQILGKTRDAVASKNNFMYIYPDLWIQYHTSYMYMCIMHEDIFQDIQLIHIIYHIFNFNVLILQNQKLEKFVFLLFCWFHINLHSVLKRWITGSKICYYSHISVIQNSLINSAPSSIWCLLFVFWPFLSRTHNI